MKKELPLPNFRLKKGEGRIKNTKFIEDIEKDRRRTTIVEIIKDERKNRAHREVTEKHFKIFYTTESLILAQDER